MNQMRKRKNVNQKIPNLQKKTKCTPKSDTNDTFKNSENQTNVANKNNNKNANQEEIKNDNKDPLNCNSTVSFQNSNFYDCDSQYYDDYYNDISSTTDGNSNYTNVAYNNINENENYNAAKDGYNSYQYQNNYPQNNLNINSFNNLKFGQKKQMNSNYPNEELAGYNSYNNKNDNDYVYYDYDDKDQMYYNNDMMDFSEYGDGNAFQWIPQDYSNTEKKKNFTQEYSNNNYDMDYNQFDEKTGYYTTMNMQKKAKTQGFEHIDQNLFSRNTNNVSNKNFYSEKKNLLNN